MEKIYCLFSIANDYDQPKNNLEIAWAEKPTFEEFCAHFNIQQNPGENILDFVTRAGEVVIQLKTAYEGTEARVFGADYRLEQVTIGKPLNQNT